MLLAPLVQMLLLGVIRAALLNPVPIVLCSTLAAVGHHICTEAIHPDGAVCLSCHVYFILINNPVWAEWPWFD